jgi:hypothetical protein
METKRKTKPAAAPPPLKAEAAPEPQRFPATLHAFEVAIRDLALEEGELPTLARKILRMRRDRAPVNEIDPILKPLFESIVGSLIRGRQKPDIDPKSGLEIVQIKQTPGLKVVLRKMRGHVQKAA